MPPFCDWTQEAPSLASANNTKSTITIKVPTKVLFMTIPPFLADGRKDLASTKTGIYCGLVGIFLLAN
jgi:hypothetical protein